MNNTNENNMPVTDIASPDTPLFPPYRMVERKIGRSTFMVYSWFNDEKEKDIVSTISRLMEYGHD